MDTENYRQRLAALREENEFLRFAAHSFGELAERLADELRQLRAQTDPGADSALPRPTDTRGKVIPTDASLRR
ncbi:MAG TPA: hypothetical protein VGI12_15900 [Vicinamibacterales bacterium]|jgi:hypothetical protein